MDWHEGAMDRAGGGLSYRHVRGNKGQDVVVNETPRAIGGINELTSPAEQCTE